MDIKTILSFVEQEIHWHKEHLGSGLNPDTERGFITGLQQVENFLRGENMNPATVDESPSTKKESL